MKWTTGGTVVTTLLQMVRLAVLARLLAVDDFGLMAMVLVVVGFGQAFADMGVSSAIIHRQDSTRAQLSSLYWLNLVAGLLVFMLILLATPLVVNFYGEPRLRNLMGWAALLFLVTPIGQQFTVLLQKELRFSALAKIEIAAALLGTLVAVGAALLGYGVLALVWGQLADNALRSLMPTWLGWRDWRPSLHFATEDLRGYLSFGLYQMGERGINYFNSRLDQIIIGVLIGAQALGYYSLAFNLVLMPVTKINPVITRVAFPVFARVQSDLAALRRGYLTVMKALSIVNFPLLLGLAAVAPSFTVQIFGPEWQPAVPIVQTLAVVALLRSTANPTGSLLLARGRADLSFKWNLMLLFTQLPGVYLGARLGGAQGVAVALLLLQVTYFIWNYRVLIRPILGPCLRDYLMTMLPAFGISLVMAVAVAGLEVLYSAQRGFGLLGLEILLGATIYLGLALLLMKGDLEELRGLFRRQPEPPQSKRAVGLE